MKQEIVKISLPNKGVLFVVCPRNQVNDLLKRIKHIEIDPSVNTLEGVLSLIDLTGLDVHAPDMTYVVVQD